MSTYANARPSTVTTAQTPAEQANTLFLELVRNLPGVVHVETFGTEAVGEQSFRVYVHDGDLTAERAVYLAKGSVYDSYPEAALDVEVLEESDLPRADADGGSASR
jgi:hypothetical protein